MEHSGNGFQQYHKLFSAQLIEYKLFSILEVNVESRIQK